MRGETLAGVALALGLVGPACGAGGTLGGADEVGYLRDASNRRAAMVSSLVNADNAYSMLRLARYASGGDDDWDRLTAWNPRVAPITVAELDAAATPVTLADDARPLTLPDEAAWEPTVALEPLGEEAFFRYPMQVAPPSPEPLTRALAERYGLWLDPTRGVGGLVRAEVPGGHVVAMTCATCHADVLDGRMVAGVPSARFDLGQLMVDAGTPDATQTERLLSWGPGRVDVTTTDASLPERISDLRPLRWLTHLQYDATVRQRDLVALAIRVETLMVTSHGQAVRPPRIVALALARYLWTLAALLPAPTTNKTSGHALFAAHCSSCHGGVGFTGAPRPLAEVGTDATLGLSPDRGTGTYRVPSLRGVGTRPTLLHDGTVPSLAALLDPARLGDDWTDGARGPGAVRGHTFGLGLSATDRSSLVAFVQAL